MFGRIHLWSCLVLNFCSYGVLKFKILFQFQWSVCSNYLFLLDLILMGSRFLETCSFLLGCQICWRIMVYSIPYGLCYYCDISFYVSFLISCLFGFSLFFLVSLARGLSILFTFSKNELLVLLIFFSIFKPLFISSLILIISFLLLILCFLFVRFLLQVVD